MSPDEELTAGGWTLAQASLTGGLSSSSERRSTVLKIFDRLFDRLFKTRQKPITKPVAFKIQTNYKHAVAEVEVVESCLLAEDLPQAAERRKA